MGRLLRRRHLAGLDALKQKRAEEGVLGQLRRTFLAEVCRAEEMAVVLTHKERRTRLIAHKVQVVPFVLDDGIEHGHAQSRVGAGLDGHPLGSLLSRNGVGGIDDDQVGASILGLHAEVPAMGLRVGRVRVPDQNRLGVSVVAGHVALVEIPTTAGHFADADQITVVKAYIQSLESKGIRKAEAGNQATVSGEGVASRHEHAVRAHAVVLSVVG